MEEKQCLIMKIIESEIENDITKKEKQRHLMRQR
jgi:hypothetical protein